MKGFKIIILCIGEVACCFFLVAMLMNPYTKHSLVAKAQYIDNPTPENRSIAEKAKREDQTMLWSVRGALALMLIINTGMLVKVISGKDKKREPTTP